ncbi:hypothetical protein ZWY2020_042082, partial [Hordeum vulgare]
YFQSIDQLPSHGLVPTPTWSTLPPGVVAPFGGPPRPPLVVPVVPVLTLGIGGFSMGVAAALHSAACYAHGKFSSGTPYQIMLSAIVSLSRWLPCSSAADEFVPCRNGERLIEFLRSLGFSYVSFKSYNGLGHYTILEEMDDGLGHYTILEEMDDLCKWLSSRLSIDRSW